MLWWVGGRSPSPHLPHMGVYPLSTLGLPIQPIWGGASPITFSFSIGANFDARISCCHLRYNFFFAQWVHLSPSPSCAFYHSTRHLRRWYHLGFKREAVLAPLNSSKQKTHLSDMLWANSNFVRTQMKAGAFINFVTCE